MVLHTQRLQLRRIAAEDWRPVKEIWEDFNASDFAQYDRPHNTQEDDVRQRIARWADTADSMEHLFFAVCLQGCVIGYLDFHERSDHSYEIGYCFHSAHHGKGYAKESIQALLSYLQAQGITRFTAGTALRNTSSVRLLHVLGFRLIEEEQVSFYQNADGTDIVFDGGIFALDLN